MIEPKIIILLLLIAMICITWIQWLHGKKVKQDKNVEIESWKKEYSEIKIKLYDLEQELADYRAVYKQKESTLKTINKALEADSRFEFHLKNTPL